MAGVSARAGTAFLPFRAIGRRTPHFPSCGGPKSSSGRTSRDGAARFPLPLAPAGTPFQKRVWAELQKIPFGQIVTYSELARRAGRPNAIRAAGAANGKNPISIVIPCHRVVGKDGSLTGYGGGLSKKEALLELEGAPLVDVPTHLRPGLSRVHPGLVARAP